jgi:hypothetical protein
MAKALRKHIGNALKEQKIPGNFLPPLVPFGVFNPLNAIIQKTELLQSSNGLNTYLIKTIYYQKTN